MTCDGGIGEASVEEREGNLGAGKGIGTGSGFGEVGNAKGRR